MWLALGFVWGDDETATRLAVIVGGVSLVMFALTVAGLETDARKRPRLAQAGWFVMILVLAAVLLSPLAEAVFGA